MGNKNSHLINLQCQEGQENSKEQESNDGQASPTNFHDQFPSYESTELNRVVVDLPKFIFAEKCSDIIEYLTSDNSDETFSCMTFKFIGEVSEINANDLQTLNNECKEKAVVILLESKSEGSFTIYWKSKELKEFLLLKPAKKLNDEAVQKLSEYVVDFLVDSLNKNYLGLITQFFPQLGSNSINLDLLADSRDYNLLLLAAEQGNTQIVEILLQLEMNASSLDNKVHAQTLAFSRQHFDVLNVLLQNNLRFPNSFEVSKCTGKLKEFCDISVEVHKLIASNDKEKLEEILDQHQNLRHFYNFSNESALKVAVQCGSLSIFDLLLSKQFRFGSHENPAEYYEHLSNRIKRKVRDIQNKYAQPFLDKHIHTLMSNSTAFYDETEAKDKLEYVQRAFTLLSENPFIRIILKIVAASKNFKIVFDFNREAVNVVDPTKNESTLGICYLSGKIFIGAKQLLNPLTEYETLAVIAHELCHLAMNLVFENKAKPYRSGDTKTMDEFEEVSADCEEKFEEDEEIVNSVYEDYPEGAHHAELIVRVVHLYAFYRNLPEKLKELRGIFIKLFEFYEKKIVPELDKALPQIEGRDEKELKKKDKKISKFKKMSIVGGILAVVGVIAAIIVGLVFYTPTYKFNELSFDDQKVVAKAPITYKNTSLEFCNLFPEKSTVYEMLTSDHISQMLNGIPLDLNDPHLHYLEELLKQNWQNLTQKLKEKFLTSNFTFQNEILKFEKLHEINSEVFNLLKSDQIIDVLSDKKLVVHEMIQNQTKFYIERKIWDENMRAIYYRFKQDVRFNESSEFTFYNSPERSNFFGNYYHEFIKRNFTFQLNEISKIKEDINFKSSTMIDFELYYRDGSKTEFILADSLSSHKSLQFDLDQAFKLANESKLFILSAEAGTGKTATFEQFTMRIKKKFPTQWVSYIDLKDHKALYSEVWTLQDVKKMLENIFGLSSENEFERKIFEKFFEAGNLILLWNGFDEISPDYSEDVMRIMRLIRDNTKNIQFVCTRPLYSDQLMLKFSVQTYTLIPFDEEEQESFVQNFLVFQNIEKSKIPGYFEKVQKISNFTKSEEGFDTPLMLLMIAELISIDVEIYETENLYEIYQKFVEKKIEIWKEKSEFARNFLPGFMTEHRSFDMLKVYQSYAMKSELQQKYVSYTYFSCLKLKLMRQKIPEELTSDEISRMGILYINGPKNFKFAHRTFGEFFIAQYLIENIYNADDEPSDKEAELRIQMLLESFKYPGVIRYIEYFLRGQNVKDLKAFDPHISKVLKTNYKNLFLVCLRKHGTSIFPLMLNFFKNDNEVLKVLLQIGENETIYTAAFSYAFLYFNEYDPLLIRNLCRSHLTDDELDKFIHGKNQKGVILYSLYAIKSSINHKYITITHDDYELDEKVIEIKNPLEAFKQIAKNLTKNEIKEFLKSKVNTQGIRYTSDWMSTKFAFNEKMWDFIEIEFTFSEQKEIFAIFFGNFPRLDDEFSANIRKFHLNKLEKYFSDSEIFEILGKNNVLYNNAGSEFFTTLWDFFVNHTTREQQIFFLLSTKPEFEFVPSFNFLLHSVSAESFETFKVILKIYETYFNTTDLQEIILSSLIDFLPNYVISWYIDKEFIEYLSKIFAGNEHSLRTFLLQKVEPTNLSLFEILSVYNDPFNKLKALSELLNL